MTLYCYIKLADSLAVRIAAYIGKHAVTVPQQNGRSS